MNEEYNPERNIQPPVYGPPPMENDDYMNKMEKIKWETYRPDENYPQTVYGPPPMMKKSVWQRFSEWMKNIFSGNGRKRKW